VILAHRTARSMMGYWRDNVVCLSFYPSVCDPVHCDQTLNPTAKVSELVNRKSHPQNTILQFSTPTPILSPQTLHLMHHRRCCHLANKLKIYVSVTYLSDSSAVNVWLPCN